MIHHMSVAIATKAIRRLARHPLKFTSINMDGDKVFGVTGEQAYTRANRDAEKTVKKLNCGQDKLVFGPEYDGFAIHGRLFDGLFHSVEDWRKAFEESKLPESCEPGFLNAILQDFNLKAVELYNRRHKFEVEQQVKTK